MLTIRAERSRSENSISSSISALSLSPNDASSSEIEFIVAFLVLPTRFAVPNLALAVERFLTLKKWDVPEHPWTCS